MKAGGRQPFPSFPSLPSLLILFLITACAGPRQNVDPEPLEANGFSLILNNRHLLDVNHVPNVTVLPEVRSAYLDLVVAWAGRDNAHQS